MDQWRVVVNTNHATFSRFSLRSVAISSIYYSRLSSAQTTNILLGPVEPRESGFFSSHGKIGS